MFAAALAALLLSAAAAPAAPAAHLDAAACDAIPGAADEGPRFEAPNGVFSLNLPSSWAQKPTTELGVSQADAAIHGSRAAFELRQGDVHRLLIARVVAPNGTRAEDVSRLVDGRPVGLGSAVTHAGAPCLWYASQGKGRAKEQSIVCDLKVKGAPARFVMDLIYLDTDTCNHGVELLNIVDTLKWGAGVTPGAS